MLVISSVVNYSSLLCSLLVSENWLLGGCVCWWFVD